MRQMPRYLVNFDSSDLPQHEFDVIIVGSGVAGLSCAYHLDRSLKVAVITKTELSYTATRYAQGGIAAAIGELDSIKDHFNDTIEVGRGLCDRDAVDVLVSEGPDCIDELKDLGVPFDHQKGRLNLGLEAGHSFPRVVHTKDFTGSEVQIHLDDAVRGLNNVSIYEAVFVVDILTDKDKAEGLLLLQDNQLSVFTAPTIVLAAGGMGQLFSVTTNPPISTGDGLAVAYRAGALLSDTEFIQFHPTALHVPGSPRFLISEAVRGEGAHIIDKNGNRFLVDVYPEAELAPRDEVVRQMFLTMRETSQDHVFLDCRHMGEDKFKTRFPAIYEKLVEHGINVAKELIPISPAAHYMSGGVKTDLDGRTNIDGLMACGEVACTGVHGANRLASNSLLEGLVFSRRVAKAIEQDRQDGNNKKARGLNIKHDFEFNPVTADVTYERHRLQETVQRWGGVLRSEESLSTVFRFLEERKDVSGMGFGSIGGFELINLLTLARIVNAACLRREESRGSHWREDFPYEDDGTWLKHIIIVSDEDGQVTVEVAR